MEYTDENREERKQAALEICQRVAEELPKAAEAIGMEVEQEHLSCCYVKLQMVYDLVGNAMDDMLKQVHPELVEAALANVMQTLVDPTAPSDN